MSEWNNLNDAAKANLTPDHFRRFLQYKQELKTQGETWEDAEEILIGFIWDTLEEETMVDDDQKSGD